MPKRESTFFSTEPTSIKASPVLIARDDEQFRRIANTIAHRFESLGQRIMGLRQAEGGVGQAAMDRDILIHQLTAERRQLSRFSSDLCLGRMVPTADKEPLYIGRFGLVDDDGQRLLVDWRAPAAEPFFAATQAHPLGVESRRRYRWSRGKITEYWDEVFIAEPLSYPTAKDDESVFIASLGSSRSPHMRDVLGTIQTDQDAIIRASGRGALVVDGGPGTGKTVVALHRTAYLLYSEPRLGRGGGGVLVVGPHRPYLAYVADVLPSLGEESVLTCTLRDFQPEGAGAIDEGDPRVAGLKASVALLGAVEAAVRHYEVVPQQDMIVSTVWEDLPLTSGDWAEAIAAVDAGTPHNDARKVIWDELVSILHSTIAERGISKRLLSRTLAQDDELLTAFNTAWPTLDAARVLNDLWSVPSYLRHCAPWLSEEEATLLQRPVTSTWTIQDVPFLDAARLRIGSIPDTAAQRKLAAEAAAEQQTRSDVADELIAADDSDMLIASILRGSDARNSLAAKSNEQPTDVDLLGGPFGHIVIDEAQELSDTEWQMLLARCPSRSFTIVGDRAQARKGFPETWETRLTRVGLTHISHATLSVNYRTPAEIMDEAATVICSALPDANVPTSIRTTGIPVRHDSTSNRDVLLREWLAAHPDGIACVIGDSSFSELPRVRSLRPELTKGLEFDLVVLVDPHRFGDSISGVVDRYVAMTRATQELVILTSPGS